MTSLALLRHSEKPWAERFETKDSQSLTPESLYKELCMPQHFSLTH